MDRKVRKTIRLDPEDAQALKRAESDGLSASDLVRRGLRIVAAQYYGGSRTRRRPPQTSLFACSDPRLGEESALFKYSRE
jgi:hypothetical protein